MKLLIQAKDILVEYAEHKVLDINELKIYDHDRIGLVGANGAGKSTLLKVLLGEINPAGCKINRLGQFTYISQLDESESKEIKDFSLTGKLGIEKLDIQNMSGGEETRLKIAQAFSEHVHGIFADEPTCNLDYDGINFLAEKLKCFSGALLIVSHDRYFLDETVNRIWELKNGKITEYEGNYTDYLREKEEQHQSQAAKYDQFVKERNRLEKAVDEKRKQARKINKKQIGLPRKNSSEEAGRLGYSRSIGSKQKTLYNAAKSMENRIAAMGDVKAPEIIRTIHFHQSEALTLHHPYPVAGIEISKRFGDKVLFEKASFKIPLGAKAALTGINGTGKTTLIRMILSHEEGIWVSSKAVIGYFAQNGYKCRGKQEIMNFMKENCDYSTSEIRSALASMGFYENHISNNLSILSGGEIIKLLLVKMLLGHYNILLMDEPNNFLDLPAIEALEAMMKNYKGTILFISHDKRLIKNAADIIYEIRDKKIVQIK